ncbi:MAG: phospholipase D-like domain-containing protein, partial [Polyangiales bacterium]
TERAAPMADGVKVGDDYVRLLRDGAEAYPAMLAAIETARREILIEFYWFSSDPLGRQFCDALAARAQEGLSVRVIYDAFGSRPVDPEMFEALAASGADVRGFHPFFGLQGQRSRWVFRDHRKILVCDGEVGFTGGLNIGRQWASEAQGGEGWRDDMVEVRGPAARELRSLFYETWRRVLRRRERRSESLLPREVFSMAPEPSRPVWALANGRGWRARRQIRATYMRWILEAKKSIDIVNAYFVPDRGIRRALKRAVRHGVQVRIVVPANGDVTFVQWAVEAGLERLTKVGVRAWAYTGAVLHAKTAVVDGRLTTIGSYNLDHRSVRYNLEVNLAIDSPEFGAMVRDSIERDIEKSTEWPHDVLKKRGFLRRMLGEFALLFARFL